MVNVVVNSVVFVLAMTCLTSSLPFGEEINKSSTSPSTLSTVNVKKSEEIPTSGTSDIKVVALSETSKADITPSDGKTTKLEEIGKDTEGAIESIGESTLTENKLESKAGAVEERIPVEITETLVPVKTNGSKDIYVIKTIVYEVGIITEADNSTLNGTESHEEINLTFFDPKHNESTIDLSNIPAPIQTNISGVSITGVVPINFGTIQLPEGDNPAVLTPNFPLPIPILPNAVISVKHNISTTNADKEAELLSTLPNLLGLVSPITGEPLKVETPTAAKAGEPKRESGKREPSKDSDSSEESSEESKEDSKESSEDNVKS